MKNTRWLLLAATLFLTPHHQITWGMEQDNIINHDIAGIRYQIVDHEDGTSTIRRGGHDIATHVRITMHGQNSIIFQRLDQSLWMINAEGRIIEHAPRNAGINADQVAEAIAQDQANRQRPIDGMLYNEQRNIEAQEEAAELIEDAQPRNAHSIGTSNSSGNTNSDADTE